MDFDLIEKLTDEEVTELYNNTLNETDTNNIAGSLWFIRCDNGRSGYYYYLNINSDCIIGGASAFFNASRACYDAGYVFVCGNNGCVSGYHYCISHTQYKQKLD